MSHDRYMLGTPPHYPEVKVQVWCNPSEDEYLILKTQQASSPELTEIWNRAAAVERRLKQIVAASERLAEAGADMTPEQEEEAQALSAETASLTEELVAKTAAATAEQDRLQLVYGALLCRVYNHQRFEFYGWTFDFSTPEAALETSQSKTIPLDLRHWFRQAPCGAVETELEEMQGGGLKKSFQRRTPPGK